MNMKTSLRETYCETWRSILTLVAGWEQPRVEDWIGGMLPNMESENSLTFHELPSTWAAWAMFPLSDPATAGFSESARASFLRVVHALHHGHELDAGIDWRTLRPIYEQYLRDIGSDEAKETHAPD